MTIDLPSYADLPLVEGGARSAWGVFGEEDSLGLMNLLSPAAVVRAAHAVKTGEIYPMDIPSDFMKPPLFQRGASRLTQLERQPGYSFDDVRDNVYSQGSSQWDALCHVAYDKDQFYNSVTAEQVRRDHRNTIHHWAARGIAGRAIVLDVAAIIAQRGHPGQSIPISVDDLESARTAAGVEFEPGDILIIHTGFLDWYTEQDEAERNRMSLRDRITSTGIEHSEAMAEYLWNAHVSACLSDTGGVEVMPPDRSDAGRPFGYLHRILIGQFGMALGELWWTSDLAAACRADGRYDCLFVSSPQNVPGAAGSPANAIAIR